MARRSCVEKRKRPGVVRDQEVGAEKDVKLVQLQLIAGGIQRGSMKDQVNVFAPVIDLGDVRLLECVLDGEGMKAEGGAQEGLGLFHRILVRILQIHPECSLVITDRLRETIAWPVEMDGAGTVAENDPQPGPGGRLRIGARPGGGIRLDRHGAAPDCTGLRSVGRGCMAW